MAGFKVLKRTNRFAAIAQGWRQEGERAEEETAKGGEAYLIAIMPEKTGAMKRSTEAVKQPRGWAIKIGVPYWRFVNDGTIYIEGQHFVEEVREWMQADFHNRILKIASRVR